MVFHTQFLFRFSHRTHVTHYESIFDETRISRGERTEKKSFMLYQNIKGDLHESFSILATITWGAAKVVQLSENCMAKTPQKRFFTQMPFVFKALCYDLFLYIPSFAPYNCWKSWKIYVETLAAAFVSHLLFQLPSLGALKCFFSSCFYSYLNKQFTGNSWMNKAVGHQFVYFSASLHFLLWAENCATCLWF